MRNALLRMVWPGTSLATLGTTTPAAAQDRPDLEYAVYSAVLRQVVLKEGWGGNPRASRGPIGRLVIISDTRAVARISDNERARLPSLDTSTAADLVRKHDEKPLERLFQDVGPYDFVTLAEIRTMPLTRDWKPFYERFPDAPGFVRFSHVGFNRASTEALVIMTHTRAALWSQTTLYLLRKAEDGWTIAGKAGLGAS
jgi:hypothetical protein